MIFPIVTTFKIEHLVLFWDTFPTLRNFFLNQFYDCAFIFISKLIIVVFGYRSFEHYLKGNAWRTSVIDTAFFGVGIWMQRIMVADKSNPAMACAMAGIFIGTFIAAKSRGKNGNNESTN